MINIKVNNKEQSVKDGTNVFEAVTAMQYVEMPSLYYLKGIVDDDTSGVAVVEINGKVVPAIDVVVQEGMEIFANSPAVMEARKNSLLDIANIHNRDCVTCFRTDNCELQDLLHVYKVFEDDEGFLARKGETDLDVSAPHLVRDMSKCIRCRRCVTVCGEIQAVEALEATGAGLESVIKAASDEGLGHTKCVHCGQCITVCPVGAIYEKDDTEAVFAALEDPKKHVIVEVAPAVRAALGEGYEFPIGVDVEGRIAEALKEFGFDKVFDTKFGADLTIMEEANEFIDRLQNGGVLPMITSCCPGWINYAEFNFHEMLDNISSCKSPHQMLGATIKSYYADKFGINKEDIVTVSVMPCVAKKGEIKRDGEGRPGLPDVDYVLTTREMIRMLKKKEIQLEAMDTATKFDSPLGTGTGAGIIFGATGGVMEAALRTVIEKLTGKELEEVKISEVRGVSGIKEASYDINGKTINVAVVSGLGNAKELLEKVQRGEADYHFIEVMACPGGCVNGGGQPQQQAKIRNKTDIRADRAEALYANDEESILRKSHENPEIIELYRKFFDKPGSEKAREMLHTSYSKR